MPRHEYYLYFALYNKENKKGTRFTATQKSILEDTEKNKDIFITAAKNIDLSVNPDDAAISLLIATNRADELAEKIDFQYKKIYERDNLLVMCCVRMKDDWTKYLQNENIKYDDDIDKESVRWI